MFLALILMDTYQVVESAVRIDRCKGRTKALAADLGRPPPPPPPPVVALKSARGNTLIGKGKGKAPPPVVTKG